MSAAIVPILAGVTASVAGAAARRRQQEEEQMAQYHSDDLEGWEFKIVRSILGRFSSQAFLKKTCEEEAKAGWEMVEKFDDQRVRFKRRVEKRSMDAQLGIDPYRTAVGTGSNTGVWIVAGLVLLLAGLATFLFLVNAR